MRSLLTWICHFCGGERLDRHVSVVSRTERFGPNGEYEMQQNRRYCNDNPECKADAMNWKLA